MQLLNVSQVSGDGDQRWQEGEHVTRFAGSLSNSYAVFMTSVIPNIYSCASFYFRRVLILETVLISCVFRITDMNEDIYSIL